MGSIPGLTQAENNALLWPIKAKGQVNRLNPLGDPTIEQYYHSAMEQGRFLEKSIADANNWILQKKQQALKYIQTYTHMNSLAVDGQLPHGARVPKYIADSISILKTVAQFEKEITGLAQAIQQNLTMLLSIEQSMLQMVQTNLNALANLLNNVCNWGLPARPSIPNLLPEGMWNWNGFNFAPLANFAKAFATPPSFNFNFSFSQCSLSIPGLFNSGALGNNTPISVTTNSGLMLGTAQYIPPLGGSSSSAPGASPVYGPTFNPNTSMNGAVPDPHTIVDNYLMPAATYMNNIVSITPMLRGDTVEPTDADYSNPNYTVRAAGLRKDLIHFITLGNIVANNYDPFITSAWLLYLNATRIGRGGNWLPNFESVYEQYIQPSITYLQNTPVPYNNVSGNGVEYMSIWGTTVAYQVNDVVTYNGNLYIALQINTGYEPDTNPTYWQTPIPANTVYENAPNNIPLIATLNSLSLGARNTLLWELSYIEASLLGYTRNQTWDAYQNANYLSNVTGSDLDYTPTAISTTTSTLILGDGVADFPTPITFPSSMTVQLNAVIAAATINIQNDVGYLSVRLGNRYTYNQFAQATLVDRFSQFWRDFATNLKILLAQDPYLVQFVITYFGTLNGALNPLADATAYNSLQVDASSRNRSWTPGTPLLSIPIAPIVSYTNTSIPTGNNGWINPPIDFDPNTFLARPDVQGQPIPVQMAMLRTNISYAALQTFKNNFQNEIAGQIANAQSVLAQSQQIGFHVTAVNDTTTVPSGASIPVLFDDSTNSALGDYDYTGNVTNPTTFTIQAAGDYAGYGQLDWAATVAGTYNVTINQNGVGIFTTSVTTTSANADLTLPFSFAGSFAQGDVVQVIANQDNGVPQNVIPQSFFSMVQTGAQTTSSGSPPVTPSDTTTMFTVVSPLPAWVSSPVPAATVVQVIQPNGNVVPVDPFVPGVSLIQITSPDVVMITVDTTHHFSIGQLIVFSGFDAASFVNNQVAIITEITTNTFTATFISYTHASYGPASDTGNVYLAIDDSGSILAPNPDGITIASAAAGSMVSVNTIYGELVQIPGLTLTVGQPVYAGLNGVLTQNYTTLVAQVGWVMYVGMAVPGTLTLPQTDTILYEPHIPTLYVQ